MDIAGIRPAAPGFAQVAVRPQLGDLDSLELTARTVRGPIGFAAERTATGHRVCVTLPADTPGFLQLPSGGRVALASGRTSTVEVPPPATS